MASRCIQNKRRSKVSEVSGPPGEEEKVGKGRVPSRDECGYTLAREFRMSTGPKACTRGEQPA